MESEERVRWRQRLPRRGPVDRHRLLLDLAEGKRVAHIGFVDERLMRQKLAAEVWLHKRLAGVATQLVGLDNAEDGVAWARDQGYEAYAVDAQSPEALRALGLEPFDLLVAGEVIEHLDAPGPFLRAMHELAGPETQLVVTTPNAYRLLNFLAPVSGSELVHPDHTAWHSPSTLRQLLTRAGWEPEEFVYYHAPIRRAGQRLGNAARAIVTTLNRIRPYWSDGIAVVSRRQAPLDTD
jgi:SAM-dependent methyltransferase